MPLKNLLIGKIYRLYIYIYKREKVSQLLSLILLIIKWL